MPIQRFPLLTAKELLAQYSAGKRNFAKSNLRGVKLRGAYLPDIDLSGSNLRNADFSKACLRGANLSGCVMGDEVFVQLLRKTFYLLDRMDSFGLILMATSAAMGAFLNGFAKLIDNPFLIPIFSASLALSVYRFSNRILELNRAIRRLFANFEPWTNLSGADLTDANLCEIHGWGANFEGATFCRTRFFKAIGLESALFRNTGLASEQLRRLCVTLDGRDRDYNGQPLYIISLRGAMLKGANLESCDLIEADLGGTDLSATNVDSALVDIRTYECSNWTVEDMAAAWNRGAVIRKMATLPESIRTQLLSNQEGLTLVFSTKLVASQRFMLDVIIRGVLGLDTDCRIEEFRNFIDGEGAIVRLTARRRDDLERVAEAILRKVWEQEKEADNNALIAIGDEPIHASGLLAELVTTPVMRAELSILATKITSIVMRELIESNSRSSIGIIQAEDVSSAIARPVVASTIWQLGAHDLSVHRNITALVSRMESAMITEDYALVVHTSACIFETLAKDVISNSDAEHHTFGKLISKYRVASQLPKAILAYMEEIYKNRGQTPLAAHGSTQIPFIKKDEAVVLSELTKSLVIIQYRIKQGKPVNA